MKALVYTDIEILTLREEHKPILSEGEELMQVNRL